MPPPQEFKNANPEFTITIMGSRNSKPSATSRDPYRDLGNRAAHYINEQYPDGLGHASIAAGVPNPKGKDPLVLYLRQNDEGKYAYDQAYYDKIDELLKDNGEGVWDKRPEGHRGSGNIDVRMKAERDGRRGEGQGEEPRGDGEGQERRGEERAPADLRGEGSEDEDAGERGQGRRLRGDFDKKGRRFKGKRNGERRGRALRSAVDVDKGRQAFIRRKK
jgi:hypothetical protein